MKRVWLLSPIVMALLVGCPNKHSIYVQQAVDVPRLTNLMHAAVIRMNHPCDAELLPDEVRQVYHRAVGENPSLDLFENNSMRIRCDSEEITVLLLDKDTGTALFEDVSCTPFLDRRWYDSGSPPQSFTISLPEDCERVQ